MIEITSKLEPQDMTKMHRQAFFQGKIILKIAFAIMIILFTFNLHFFINKRITEGIIHGSVTPITFSLLWGEFDGYIYFILFLLFYFFIMRIFLNQSYKTNKELQANLIYSINEESISLKTPQTQSLQKWEEVFRVLETKDYFHVFISTTLKWVIPKRFFSEDELGKFRDYGKKVKKNNFKKK